MVIDSKKFFYIALAIIVTDQIVKFLIVGVQQKLPFDIIPGLLSFSYAQNTGLAFGLLPGNNLMLSIINAAVAALIIFYRKKLTNILEVIAAALILGGALSNLTDRLTRSYVIDYIALKGLPTFNVADAALTIGAALIITAYLKDKFDQRIDSKKLPTESPK